jgi:hypothetical protein
MTRAGRAVLAYSALTVVLFPRALLKGEAFFQRDLHVVWYGQALSFVRCVFSGSLPLWDPYVGFGQPMLANANTQIAYPFTWLHLLFMPWTVYTVTVAVHTVLGATGTYVLGRRLGLSEWAALVGGALWSLSGPILSLVNVWNHLCGAAWLPWVFLMADRFRRRPSWRAAIGWGALTAAPLLAGSPDVCLMAGLASGAWCLAGRPRTGRRLVLLALAGAAAAAISAVQWLPLLEVARRSERWTPSEEARTFWSLHPAASLGLAIPVRLQDLPWTVEAFRRLDGGAVPYLSSVYLGLGTAAFVCAALLAPGGHRVFFGAVAAMAGLFSLGLRTPVYPALIAVVPPLESMRFPEKALVLVAFAWTMLAARGADAWRTLAPGRRRASLVAASVLVVAAAGAAAFLVWGDAPWFRPRPGAPDVAPEVAHTARRLGVSALLAAAGIGALVAGARRAAATAPLALALAIGDLWLANRGVNPTTKPELFTTVSPALGVIDQTDRSRMFVYDYGADVSSLDSAEASPYRYVAPASLRDDEAAALALRVYPYPAVPTVWSYYGSYDPDVVGLSTREVASLTQRLGHAEGTPAHLRLLQLGAVGHVVSLHDAGLEGLTLVRRLQSMLVEPVRVWRVPDPLPRAYAVGSVRRARGPAALALMLDPGFDIHREVVLDGEGDTRATPDFRGSVALTRLAYDRAEADADLGAAGHVVLVDAYDPGWRVRVDGRPATLVRANVAFRAVEVPAGRHRIEQRYRPAAASVGAVISTLALGGMALAALPRRTPRREAG